MWKANRCGKETSSQFGTLRVSSKSPPLLPLEELIKVQQEEHKPEEEENYEPIEYTPIPTSFHSGCLVHEPYSQLIIVGGCFDDDDDDYDETTDEQPLSTNAVMGFNYMENKWGLLCDRTLPVISHGEEEEESTSNEDSSNEASKISQINISSDLGALVQSPMVDRSATHDDEEQNTNVPPRIWGHSCSYCPISRTVYLFGGIDFYDNYNEHLYAFSLVNREWRRVKPEKNDSLTELPCGRQGHRTVYVPSLQKIVLFGGFSNSHLDDFLEYDVRNNKWSKIEEDPDFKENRPSCREVFSMVYAENRNSVLIFGGKIEDERYSDLREYSFTTKRWTVLHYGQTKSGRKPTSTPTKKTLLVKDEPSDRSSHTAVYLESYQKMIVLAGYNGEEWFSDCYEFDFNTLKWSSIKLILHDLPDSEREFFEKGFSSHVAEFNKITNEILVFGGWDGSIDSNILFSIQIPSFNTFAMRSKLFNMDDLFSDISIECINSDEHQLLESLQRETINKDFIRSQGEHFLHQSGL